VPLLAWAALAGVATLACGSILAATDRLRSGLMVQAAAMALLGVAGVAVLAGGQTIGAPFHSTVGLAFGLDPLSGLFLALLSFTAIPTLLFARDYLPGRPHAPAVGALTGVFLLSLAGVLAARDVVSFLVFWELMTLVPAAAILLAGRDREARSAVYAYIAITHLGGAGVWIALLALAHHGGIGDPAAMASAGTGAQTLVAVAALIGFGTKAGFIPLHSWLPRAHPVAPAHLSALMSGMMLKVALYGLIRVEFDWLGTTPRWLGLALLAVGLCSCLGGVLWALVQRDLKRLLAYSSIENVGIVALALGASLLFSGAGDRTWADIAFAAALLQITNHAVFKTLLFLGAGALDRATGSMDLDHLGGLLRRMPWTGGAFLVGGMAIAGLPPLNGFASEWLVLQSLVHVVIREPLGIALAGALALGGLAATAALALLCFAQMLGLTLLGVPRTQRCAQACDPPVGMRAAMAALALMCVALGLAPGLLLPTLAGLAPGAGAPVAALGAGLHVPGSGSYPTLGLALAIAALTGVLASARGKRRAAPSASWACGQPFVPALRWSSESFTKPLRLVLESILRPRRTIEVTHAGGMVQSVSYEGEVHSLLDRALYEPTVRTGLRAAALARRTQSGNVRTYAAYLLGLVMALLVLAQTGILG